MPALAIAHRAANFVDGLAVAHALGADVVECDVHEHRGRLEVRHLKMAGPLPFLWDKWEARARIRPAPGARRAARRQPARRDMMLDLKGRRVSTALAVMDLVSRSGYRHPLMVCSRHWPLVDVFAGLPSVGRVLSARNRIELARLRRRLAETEPVYGVSVHRSLLDRRVVAELSRFVEVVMTWPVNDLAALDDVLDLGVTGVISDEDAVVAELVRRRGRS
ncbi:hypothetical protein [Aeromicrobium sp. UC242_57]|uniref:hypothetical protein n=1 Tax=Aeromicrobium sp. UC242_57 TaxID=3374624 RepID=UPI00379A7BE6